MNRKTISNGVVCECETGFLITLHVNQIPRKKTIPYLRKQKASLPISESVVFLPQVIQFNSPRVYFNSAKFLSAFPFAPSLAARLMQTTGVMGTLHVVSLSTWFFVPKGTCLTSRYFLFVFPLCRVAAAFGSSEEQRDKKEGKKRERARTLGWSQLGRYLQVVKVMNACRLYGYSFPVFMHGLSILCTLVSRQNPSFPVGKDPTVSRIARAKTQRKGEPGPPAVSQSPSTQNPGLNSLKVSSTPYPFAFTCRSPAHANAQPVQTDPEPDAHALLLYKLEHDTGHPSQHRVRCSQLIFYEYRLSVSSSLTRPRSTLKHPPKLISRILSLFLSSEDTDTDYLTYGLCNRYEYRTINSLPIFRLYFLLSHILSPKKCCNIGPASFRSRTISKDHCTSRHHLGLELHPLSHICICICIGIGMRAPVAPSPGSWHLNPLDPTTTVPLHPVTPFTMPAPIFMLVRRHLPNGLCSIQASGTEYGYPSLTPPPRQSHVLDYADRGVRPQDPGNVQLSAARRNLNRSANLTAAARRPSKPGALLLRLH
ncbi:uncharacterized protein CLUP02_14744 [Colletotrichum lupini]|uniref:Uncharacterized protein n=1 Tax=Colletotrichum lupini TaxID=145971 RepID=A0A9Q8T6V3_9PEZI|nr:uncharacterized protein CLUP02_14744 [Colletotrichum lupini]UQC89216.1 hypothetical protein CLUP02_14744 [Colletotrichum lupini]